MDEKYLENTTPFEFTIYLTNILKKSENRDMTLIINLAKERMSILTLHDKIEILHSWQMNTGLTFAHYGFILELFNSIIEDANENMSDKLF